MAEHAPHHDPLSACPNCDTVFDTAAAAPRYCPHCGQEAVLHPPSVAEFAHEFVGHYVAFEGSLWRTLRLLVFRPGRLTAAYLAGKRRHYVLPLRLYLSASFLFFLLFKLFAVTQAPEPPAGAHEARAVAAVPSSAADARPPSVVRPGSSAAAPAGRVAKGDVHAVDCGMPGTADCTWYERRMNIVAQRWAADPDRSQAEFVAHWLSAAPYAVFLLLPAFAAVVGLAYRNRRMLFGEHLVFGLHMHAFWFLAGAVTVLAPFAGPWLMFATLAYGVVALHAVYGGGWPRTIARAFAILVGYGALLTLASVLLTVALVV